jgi:hypothetical protein
MALNVEHINKVLEHIRENPKRLHMSSWGFKVNEAEKFSSCFYMLANLSQDYFPKCNTLACFAGWSKILATPKEKFDSIFDERGILGFNMLGHQFAAEEAHRLGLTEEESFYLFDSTAGTHQEQLEVVENRLRHIVLDRIKKGEAEAAGVNIDLNDSFPSL